MNIQSINVARMLFFCIVKHMLISSIIMVILGILGRVFASVGHISDSTAKAMGWTILNKIVSIISGLLLFLGVPLFIISLLIRSC